MHRHQPYPIKTTFGLVFVKSYLFRKWTNDNKKITVTLQVRKCIYLIYNGFYFNYNGQVATHLQREISKPPEITLNQGGGTLLGYFLESLLILISSLWGAWPCYLKIMLIWFLYNIEYDQQRPRLFIKCFLSTLRLKSW